MAIAVNLFRGFNKYFPDGEYINPFINTSRKPKDTDLNIHKISDSWFEDKFGISARSKTIFCSTSIDQAEHYYSIGNSLAQINPIGQYKVIFSPLIIDFTEHRAYINSRSSTLEIHHWLNTQDYQCIDDTRNIPYSFQGEIMLYCESYKLTNLRAI